MKGIKAISDHRAVAYVSDARKVKVIVHEDQEWIKDTWLPLALAAGLKRIAFVVAPAGLGKMTIEEIAVLVGENGLRSGTFNSMTDARAFVKEPQEIRGE